MVDSSTATLNQPITPRSTQGFATSVTSPADTIHPHLASFSQTTSLQFPQEDIKYKFNIRIAEYSSRIGGQAPRPTPETAASIILPLPESLRDIQTVDWTRENVLRDAFTIAGGLIGGGALLFGARGQTTKESLTQMGRTAGLAGVAGAGLYAVGLGTRLAGWAPNQFITILLNGPEYKQHNLSWLLAAKTPEEAEVLRKIVQLLNNSMAPKLGTGIDQLGGFLAGWYWNFPSIFFLEFSPNPQYLFRFKPSVMTNFMVDYAGDHVPSFLRSDNATKAGGQQNLNPPEALRITMQFLEIEYWKSGEFNETGTQISGTGQPVTSGSGNNETPSGTILTNMPENI